MNIQEHDYPFTGSPDEVVGTHEVTTGYTKVGYGWFGRKHILFEVKKYLTVDLGGGGQIDLHQYLQSTEWIRA